MGELVRDFGLVAPCYLVWDYCAEWGFSGDFRSLALPRSAIDSPVLGAEYSGEGFVFLWLGRCLGGF